MTAWTEATGRAVVTERSGGRCELCGQQGDGVHHRLKRSAGGTWSPANLLRLCGSGTTGCHGAIEGNPDLARQLGLWLVRGERYPELRPALCTPYAVPVQGWWLPEPDGTWTWATDPNATDLRAMAALMAARA